MIRTIRNNALLGSVRRMSSTDFLPVHDHKRLPGRFFARLRHSDGCGD